MINLARSRQFKIRRVRKSWRYLFKDEKLMFLHLALISNPEYVPVKVTLRFSPSTEEKVKNNPNYARDQIRDVLNTVLGKGQFDLYIVTLENKPRRQRFQSVPPASPPRNPPLHIHGCIGIKRGAFNEAVVAELESALSKSHLSSKFRRRGKNKAADVSPTFLDRKFNRQSPISMRWIKYIVGPHILLRVQKSEELKKAAKTLHGKCRNGTQTFTVPISHRISGLDWIDAGP